MRGHWGGAILNKSQQSVQRHSQVASWFLDPTPHWGEAPAGVASPSVYSDTAKSHHVFWIPPHTAGKHPRGSHHRVSTVTQLRCIMSFGSHRKLGRSTREGHIQLSRIMCFGSHPTLGGSTREGRITECHCTAKSHHVF